MSVVDRVAEWFESPTLSNWVAESSFLAIVAIGLFFVTHFILLKVLYYLLKDVSNIWVQAFTNRRFLVRVSWLTPLVVLYNGIHLVSDVPSDAIMFLQKTILILFTFFSIYSLIVLLDGLNDAYSTLPVSKNKPIKGILQVVDILLFLVGTILILSIIFDKSPWAFLSGLGAMTAILMLVFKDTILSLVAGLQITTNDFIRIGDWLELPQFGADGDVIDISLHAIQIKNWDLTITTIPTHKFLEHSYKNWRGMQNSGGRRIKRSLFIDIDTVNFLSDEEIQKFKKMDLLKDYIESKQTELAEANKKWVSSQSDPINMRRLTNLGTFRAYLISYLKNHPLIHQNMTLMVRQLASGSKGVPLEVYAFTKTTKWAEYEGIQSDVFDHIFAIIEEFNLKVYQEPSGSHFEKAFEAYVGDRDSQNT